MTIHQIDHEHTKIIAHSSEKLAHSDSAHTIGEAAIAQIVYFPSEKTLFSIRQEIKLCDHETEQIREKIAKLEQEMAAHNQRHREITEIHAIHSDTEASELRFVPSQTCQEDMTRIESGLACLGQAAQEMKERLVGLKGTEAGVYETLLE